MVVKTAQGRPPFSELLDEVRKLAENPD